MENYGTTLTILNDKTDKVLILCNIKFNYQW